MNNFDDALVYGAYEEERYDSVLQSRGYTPLSTFYSDLSIAEFYDTAFIRETFENVRRSWLDDYRMFTEFVMCLKDKSKEWTTRPEDEHIKFADTYNELFYKGQETFFRKYEGDKDALEYYYKILNYE